MAKQKIVRAARGLRTASPSDRLDERIRAVRDSAPASGGPIHPVLNGWMALFGLTTGLAGFAVGFVIATGFAPSPEPSATPEVRVRWVLSEQGAQRAFDFSQAPEPLFGHYFDRVDSEQGTQP